MLLAEYAAELARVIDDYSQTGLIVDSSITTDSRSVKMGVIRGQLTFIDESQVFFTEYLDLRYKPEKLSYSFHYQNRDNEMLFRYDNARHKPALDFFEHKHLADGRTVHSPAPILARILDEIMDYFL